MLEKVTLRRSLVGFVAVLPMLLSVSVACAQTSRADIDTLLDWAEIAYPQYFPSAQRNRTSAPYTYRYYAESGNHVGVAGTGVWVLGPVAGSLERPVYVGEVSTFTCGMKPQACADKLQFRVLQAPSAPIEPGLMADPDPLTIQDGGLNSSIVLQLTRNGLPAVDEEVAWAASDPTGSIQFTASRSDRDGIVRMWYGAGAALSQRVSARHVGTQKVASVSMARVGSPRPTVGRYASTYFDAPPGEYSAYAISVIPQTAPLRTYYAVSSFWRTDSSFALYGGFQMTDCAAVGSAVPSLVAACSTSQGRYRGRIGLYSVWDGLDSNGSTLRPKLVSASPSMSCQPFDHEGSGLQCIGPIAWDIGEEWQWKLEMLAGAPTGYQRMRVTASSTARQILQDIATIDVPGKVNMRSAGAFNENWAGGAARSCLDVELRAVKIVGMGFWNGTSWVGPERGIGMGGSYSEGLPRCQNYAFQAEPDGLRIASGGAGLWVNLTDALVYDPSSQRRIFTSQDQLLSQWQSIDISKIRVPTGR